MGFEESTACLIRKFLCEMFHIQCNGPRVEQLYFIREQTVQNVHYRGFNWNLERIIEQVFAQMGKFPKALEFILSSHKKRLADK